MKKLLIIALAFSLGGCATQFGTRITKALPHRHPLIVKAAPAPMAIPTPVIVAAPAPQPASVPQKPKTFFQRHPIRWTH